MSASVKITLRDEAGRLVEIEAIGHANQYTGAILPEAEAAALKLAAQLGIKLTPATSSK